MNVYSVAGVASFLFYALSFAGVQVGRLDGNSLRYSAANTTAAVLMLTSNIDQFNLASVLVSIFFAASGAVGMARHYRHRRSVTVRPVVLVT